MSHRGRTTGARALAAVLCVIGLATVVPSAQASPTPTPTPTPAATTTPDPGQQPRGNIADISSEPGRLDLVFTGLNLPPGSVLDPLTVRVDVDDEELESTAAPASSGEAVKQVAVLTIDTSGSMKEEIAAAKAAAISFLDQVPAEVLVGLVTFSDDARTVQIPTTNRAVLRAEIQKLVAAGDTALFDAVLLALRQAGSEGARTVVLLSDGEDDGSTATYPQAVAAAQRSGAVIQAISLGAIAPTSQLAGLAAATNGTVVADAAVDDLAAAFESSAESITNQLAVTSVLPDDLLGADVTVRVSASYGGTPVEDTTFYTLPAQPAPSESASPAEPQAAELARWARWGDNLFPFALIAIFLGLLVLLVLAFAAVPVGRDNPQQLRRKLSFYSLGGGAPTVVETDTPTTTSLSESSVARGFVGLAGKVVQRRDFEDLLFLRLEAAGIPLKPAEWLLLHVGSAVGVALLLLVVFGGRLAPMLVGLFAGLLIPWVFLNYRENKRRNAFLTQMPDALQLIAGSLSAGYSLPQAVDTVVREGIDPISTEFHRALVETRLGVPLEDALAGVADRMDSQDFTWVVMALRIQREVGGNLAEVLGTVSSTMRERARLRRQVEILSAEGKLSAWILVGLPLVFVVYLVLVRPDYLRPLVDTRLGWALILLSGVLLLVGGFWLRRTVRVRV